MPDDEAMNCAHLFVYGTLMASAPSEMGRTHRQLLQRSSTRLGPASVPGVLLDLGHYPGLIVDRRCGTSVHGEILRLENPVSVMKWLDEYEGISADPTTVPEYRRALECVDLDSGAVLQSWIYVYVGSVAGRPVIASGRWAGLA